MAKYDVGVVLKFADQLYSRALITEIAYTFVGAVTCWLAATFFAPRGLDLSPVVVLLLGGLVGAAAGLSRAFALKVEAQRFLVLAQIELNTRSIAASLSPQQYASDPEPASRPR